MPPFPPPPPPPSPPPAIPTHLILDFDSTLTHSSTLHLVASLKPSGSLNLPSPSPSGSPLKPFTQAYLSDYASHLSTYSPAAAFRITLEQEYAWLASLEGVEQASIRRLERGGLWAGFLDGEGEEGVFCRAARRAVERGEVRVRDGAGKLVGAAVDGGGEGGGRGRVDVVSVNWSGRWIREVLRAGLGGTFSGREDWNREGRRGEESRVEEVDELLKEMRVMSNEIDPAESGRLSRTKGVVGGEYEVYWPREEDVGGLEDGKGLWTAEHKVEVMRDVLDQLYGKNGGCRSVYVGDSATDLMCLMEADVGICIRDEKGSSEQRELAGVLDRVGVVCSHIEEYCLSEKNGEGEGKKTLWWARDFHEIRQALF